MNKNFVAEFVPEPAQVHALLAVLRLSPNPVCRISPVQGGPGMLRELRGLLPSTAAALLKEMPADKQWLPAPENGYQKEHQPGAPAASWRASWYSKAFAEALWLRLMPFLPDAMHVDGNGVTNWDGHALWRPVGVNPLLRFIRYEAGGRLIPHYDYSYVESSERRTLMSLVMYLDEECEGGATRFLFDDTAGIPFAQRDFSDRPGLQAQALTRKKPRRGDAIVFDHYLLHDGDQVLSGSKLIVRSDIVFEKVRA